MKPFLFAANAKVVGLASAAALLFLLKPGRRRSSESCLPSSSSSITPINVSSSSSSTCATVAINYPSNLGLGNMMFFYASLLGISKKTRKPAYFALNRHFAPFDIFELGPVTARNFILGRQTLIVREESSGRYLKESASLPCQSHVILEGYFQSWKYFQDIQDEIRASFRRFTPEVAYKCNARLRESLWEMGLQRSRVQLVGIHLRRGDFTSTSAQEYGFAPAKASFIRAAIQHFLSSEHGQKGRKKLVFLVLGNDYEWNKANVPRDSNATIAVLQPDPNPGVDLCILASSQLHAISTGSFGWWAAFVGGGPTVYQAEFAHSNTSLFRRIEPRDYFLPHWKAIT